jgi:hypothetical protein
MMLTAMPGAAFALKCLIVIMVALAFVCLIAGSVLAAAGAAVHKEDKEID